MGYFFHVKFLLCRIWHANNDPGAIFERGAGCKFSIANGRNFSYKKRILDGLNIFFPNPLCLSLRCHQFSVLGRNRESGHRPPESVLFKKKHLILGILHQAKLHDEYLKTSKWIGHISSTPWREFCETDRSQPYATANLNLPCLIPYGMARNWG